MRFVLLAAVIVLVMVGAEARGATFYAASDGDTVGDGSAARPLGSVQQALDRVRERVSHGELQNEIVLLPGEFYTGETIRIGQEHGRLSVRAESPGTARITGGKEIRTWAPVRDAEVAERLGDAAGQVRQADLKTLGISDFGEIGGRGFGRALLAAPVELFYGGEPMQIARWPNEGWLKIAGVPKDAQGADNPNSGEFFFAEDRPAGWKDPDDLHVHGYWTWDWAESYEKVERLEVDSKVVATEAPHGVYGYKTGGRFYFVNVLEELDAPGEYFIDRKSGVLYFWPPDGAAQQEAVVSVQAAPLFEVYSGEGVKLQDLSFGYARGTGVVIHGGHNNLIERCDFANVGNVAVVIGQDDPDYLSSLYQNPVQPTHGGSGNGIRGCRIRNSGDNGVILGGGDRQTLQPGRNFVTDSEISHFSRWGRTYRPAVAINGVGNSIQHNDIHDAPHSAIILHGNDHLIAYNNIHRVCLETNDAGAFYMGRDYTERGNRIICNYFHDLGTAPWVHAVYLDDFASGTEVRGNICYNAGAAVFIGGGRDNTVENNIFVKCRPGMQVDARGLGWASSWFQGRGNILFQRLDGVNYRQPPYSRRYPRLKTIEQDDPAVPKGNRLLRNVCHDGQCIGLMNNLTEDTVLMKDNWTEGDPGFIRSLPENPAPEDFRLKPSSPVWELGFQPIPVAKIGVREQWRLR